MNKNIIILLSMALVASAIGQFTGQDIRNNIRLVRRGSRRRTEQMTNAANRRNGRLGVDIHLLVN